jgi:hypothetical protein
MTGYPEVIPGTNFQRRGPQVGFWDLAIDVSQARFWITSGLPTSRPEYARMERHFSIQLVLPRIFPRRCLGCQECQSKSKTAIQVRHPLVIFLRFW